MNKKTMNAIFVLMLGAVMTQGICGDVNDYALAPSDHFKNKKQELPTERKESKNNFLSLINDCVSTYGHEDLIKLEAVKKLTNDVNEYRTIDTLEKVIKKSISQGASILSDRLCFCMGILTFYLTPHLLRVFRMFQV